MFGDSRGARFPHTRVAVALDAVPTDELGPVATSMLRSARPLGDIEGTILLAVPNGFTKQWIEDKAQTS